jgi:hypothetical protein
MCRALLDSDEATVRIEAYKLLSRHEDPSIYTRWIKDGKREVFAMDLVRSTGKPLVYASSQGVPRVAVFGSETQLDLPVMFTSMDQRLTISSEPDGSTVTIFYRGSELKRSVSARSTPNLPEIVARLAGDSDSAASTMHFSYADVVGVLQELIEQQRVSGRYAAGGGADGRLLASFVLQEPSNDLSYYDPVNARPVERNGSRPQSDKPGPNDKPADDHLLRHPATAPVAVVK